MGIKREPLVLLTVCFQQVDEHKAEKLITPHPITPPLLQTQGQNMVFDSQR